MSRSVSPSVLSLSGLSVFDIGHRGGPLRVLLSDRSAVFFRDGWRPPWGRVDWCLRAFPVCFLRRTGCLLLHFSPCFLRRVGLVEEEDSHERCFCWTKVTEA